MKFNKKEIFHIENHIFAIVKICDYPKFCLTVEQTLLTNINIKFYSDILHILPYLLIYMVNE